MGVYSISIGVEIRKENGGHIEPRSTYRGVTPPPYRHFGHCSGPWDTAGLPFQEGRFPPDLQPVGIPDWDQVS